MTKEIFVDSGAWVALADRRDKFYETAVEVYPSVLKDWGRLVTTNLVIAESYALIRGRLGHSAAIIFLNNLSHTRRLDKVLSNVILESQAEEILRRYGDQDFSYVDAVSFALMRQRGISEAFTFDHHFSVLGFLTLPEIK
ncbi:MAG: PIN domain-containing protein [Anaerolineales bacterium]|nr:PIN domain-containing protein [Anaerolineales bacterium]